LFKDYEYFHYRKKSLVVIPPVSGLACNTSEA